MDQKPNKFVNWIKTSKSAKMLTIGFLSIVLLIPLSYIENLILERSYLQENVVNEINTKWGKDVNIYGPILKIPYKIYSEKIIKNEKTKQITTEVLEHISHGYFFPEELNIKTDINPELKKRGIYTTAVYNSVINLTGNFKNIDFKKAEIPEKDILWNKAKIVFKTSNVKGISTKLAISINNKKYNLTSVNTNNNKYNKIYTLESNIITLKKLVNNEDKIDFKLSYNVKGSKSINFTPIGKETNAQIKSSWKTASFIGEFLPFNSDKITKNGFNAKWKVLDINRPFSQEYFNNLPNLDDFNFGVNFKIPVDEYQKSLRSAKYGYLVISLTFLVFFLIQTISKINIHPFQYLMIGLALVMFYTLLVSISEHSNFLKAYGIACISVVSLLSFYAKSILNKIKFTSLVTLSLLILYVFIFVIIQLETYALLVGSIGLFVILASVMLVSRKIDWS